MGVERVKEGTEYFAQLLRQLRIRKCQRDWQAIQHFTVEGRQYELVIPEIKVKDINLFLYLCLYICLLIFHIVSKQVSM